MKKKIFFSLLFIINTSIYGMNNPIILSYVTNQLCITYHYQPAYIKKDIKTLSITNKLLHDYYSAEKNQQQIVRFCSDNLNSNDEYIAQELGCHAIVKKIDYLSSIVRDQNKQFTQQDLKDPWYLNCTTNCVNRSLLYIAIDHLKVITIN
ncbi:MAG TPA: hypothetical protein VL201_00055, partial [Patescibacteria group bacterium]|nr:hypothetical protein [Patescibacteria group bacterium]